MGFLAAWGHGYLAGHVVAGREVIGDRNAEFSASGLLLAGRASPDGGSSYRAGHPLDGLLDQGG
jgi:hypothetical protein